MMKMNFTKEQQEAIEKSGKSIIVSAGAGSGKTAVLTERVLYKIKNGININELLILTFTKAAALEMKERIRAKLEKETAYQDQLSLIDTAYIGTFDSFALSILKKYSYLKNIRPDVKIADSTIIFLQKKKLLDEIFNDLYIKKDDDFLKFIHDFCIKNDKEIKKFLLKLDNKWDILENKLEFLNNYVDNFYNEENINNLVQKYEQLLKDEISTINHLLNLLKNYADNAYYEKVLDIFNPILNVNTYEELKTFLTIKIPRLPSNSIDEVKEIKNRIKKQWDYIISLCNYDSTNSMKEELFKTKPIIKTIMNILATLTKQIQNWKTQNDLYEFQDVAIKSLEIIKENEKIREEIKNSFKEIMVDEYQDTNDLQNHFLNLISNNNLYVVGDIKQSIYRFRNANPKNFKEKYDLYKNGIDGYKIDLNKNFRSRKEVLNNINFIFNQIMDDEIGNAKYKQEHQMIYGNLSYDNEGKLKEDTNMSIIRYNFDPKLGYKKEELEAYYIAKDIISKIKDKYLIYNGKKQSLVPVSYKDFAILIDRSTKFPLYKKIFEYMGIPISIEKDENIKSETEIVVLKNILGLILSIYNQVFDKKLEYYYVSIARSFVFEMNDQEIFEKIKNHQYFDTELFKKAQEITKIIDYSTPNQILKTILNEFNIYEALIKIGNVSSRITRIESLLDIAQNFSNMGYDIITFKEHMDEIMNSELDLKITAPHNDNDAVLLTTIHKSKGLEYPICYFPELYKKFNIDDLKDKFLYDEEYGISATLFDEGFKTTIIKPLLKKKYIKEEISERMRLFYVALTRAKEKMIFITSYPDKMEEAKDEWGIIDTQVRLEYRSFQDILSSIQNTLEPFYKEVVFEKNDVLDSYKFVKSKPFPKIDNQEKYILKEIPWNLEIQKNKHFSKSLNKLLITKEKNNIELGLLLHQYLENLDFIKPQEYLNKLEPFYQKKLKDFLNTPLLKDVSKANILKEYEFIYQKDNIEYHGIIDLMLEYEDHIDIIDYKLKSIDDENYLNQLHGYQEYIENLTDKQTDIYLYSILDNTMKKLN